MLGWEEKIIWCIVNDEMKRKTDGPPDSIRYFEKPIARLYARLQEQELELAELQAKQGRR